MNNKTTIFLLSQIRKFSVSNSLNKSKNHYESLGLTKNATQSDIKGAYYDLSKVYHPDKNQGYTSEQRELHSQKFRDITEAYEILGNVRTRRMYDKGFMADSPHTDHHKTSEDPLHKFYKSRETRHRPPPADGKTPIYDFDVWSRKHYEHAFRRKQEMKKRHDFHAKMNADMKDDAKLEIFVWGGVLFIVLCLLIKEADKLEISVLFGANHRYKHPELYNKDYIKGD